MKESEKELKERLLEYSLKVGKVASEAWDLIAEFKKKYEWSVTILHNPNEMIEDLRKLSAACNAVWAQILIRTSPELYKEMRDSMKEINNS